MKTLQIDTPFDVFSDVHGNLPGLEAILHDTDVRGLPATISLGDLVGYGPSPNEVALLVRDPGIPSLTRNDDRGIGFETGDCGCVYKTEEQQAEGAESLEWTRPAVSDEVKAYLRTLDDHFSLATPIGDLLAVHGSPRRINEYLFEDRPAKAMERMAREFPYRVILFGHTHVPDARPVGDTTFANVGSGGRPKDSDWRVCYAVVDPTRLGGPGFVEFVRVPCGHERLLHDLAATSLITTFTPPWASARQ